jgi:hypothetical protein
MDWLSELPDWLRLVLTLVPAVVILIYVGVPVLVRFQAVQASEPAAFETFSPEQVASDVPPDVRAWFEEVAAALGAEGFTAGEHLAHGDLQNAFSLLRVYRHPSEHHVATATRLVIRAMTVGEGAAEWRKESQSLQLVTQLEGGGSVATTNTALPYLESSSPARQLHSLPQVQDPARLLRLHRALVARQGGTPVAPPPDLGELQVSSLDAQIEDGTVQRLPDGSLRPTWKGAFLLTWSWLWPLSALRRARLRRRAEALLADLGI